MDIKSKILTVAVAVMFSSHVAAQTAETFKQPYPLGSKLSPNPNFTGDVWLSTVTRDRTRSGTLARSSTRQLVCACCHLVQSEHQQAHMAATCHRQGVHRGRQRHDICLRQSGSCRTRADHRSHSFLCGQGRLARMAEKVWGVKGSTQEETAALGIDALEDFIKEIGLPIRWSEVGVTDEQVLRAAADTCFITPGCCRQMSRDEIFEILKEIM